MPFGNSSNNDKKAQSTVTAVFYALPAMPLAFLFGPIAVLQGIYAKYFGLSLITIATILFISRIFDAVTDPIIGYLSDRYYSRKGSYKPFIVSGVLLFLIASWFLFVPIDIGNMQRLTSVSPGYFLFWFLMFYLAYTVFEIPHLAWGNKLALDALEKNKVYAMRSVFALSGGLCFYTIPFLPMFETNEITPETLKWAVGLMSLIILPMLFMSIKIVPKSLADLSQPNNLTVKKSIPGFSIQHVFRNKPLVTLLGACVFFNLGFGMWATLLFLFVDSYIGMGEKYALISIIATICGLLSIKGWFHLANLWSKKTAWMAGAIMMAVGMFFTGILSPSKAGLFTLGLCVGLNYIGLVTLSMIAPSLLSDIADYGSWKFDSDCAGIYFSFFLLINKTIGSFGGAVAMGLAGWYGFDPTINIHGETQIQGLRMAIAWIPMVFICVSILFIREIPISERQHNILRRRLGSRFC